MPEQILEIQAFLDRLGRRERRLLGGRALLQTVAACTLLLVGAGLAFSYGATRATVVGWLGTAGLLLVWVALGWPLVPGWRKARDRARQARLVEGIDPSLRSRLLTVIDPVAARTGSPALLQRAVAKVAGSLAALPPRRVHPPKALGRAAGLASGLMLLGLLAGLVLPIGPIDALRVIGGASMAKVRAEATKAELRKERALVGDIVLRYVYPEYTGLEPIEVPNSDGTVHAPPGTLVQVTARTAEPFDAAALQAYEGEPVDVRLVGGRDLAGSMLVEGDGVWRFVLFRGSEVVHSDDFRILAEADAAPVVALDEAPGPVPVDVPLGLQWSVQDDYGIERVVVEVELNGQVREVELRAPLDNPSDLRGRLSMSPGELGLKAGDEAILRVVAYDNDLLGGSKRGASPDMKLEVSGPRSGGQRLTRYHKELRDALLMALADFLEESVPPASDAAGMSRWVESARERLVPVQAIYERQWGDQTPDGIDGTLVTEVIENAAVLFRFTLTTYEAGSARRITPRDTEVFTELHNAEVASLEQAVWVIDSMLQQLALQEVAQSAQRLAEEAQELAQMADTAEAAELLARLDRLERFMESLAEAAAQLSEGQLQEFLNARMDESARMMDEIRKAIAEGRLDDAREMMKQLAQQLQELSEGLNDRMAQQQSGEDQLAQLYEQVQEQLEQLEVAQQELAEQLSEAREQEGEDFARQLELWAEVEALAQRAQARADQAMSAAGDGQGWRSESLRKLALLQGAIANLMDPIKAREAARALEAVRDATLPVESARRGVEYEERRPRVDSDPMPGGVAAAAQGVLGARQDLLKIEELLSELADDQPQESPRMQQLARQLAEQQRQLEQQQQKLEQQVGQLEQQMPTGNGEAKQAMEQAGEAMERAGQQLEQGRSMPGEGHQRDASGQVRAARDALERQMAEAQQMQQSMQQMAQGSQKGQGGEGGDKEGAGGSPQQRARIEIPAPEDFQTPEQYRRALLEGMSGDVPEEFEALKRRYYEDLVRQ